MKNTYGINIWQGKSNIGAFWNERKCYLNKLIPNPLKGN